MALNDSTRQLFIIRMIDGQRMLDLDAAGLKWSVRLNKGGTLSADIRVGSSNIDNATVRTYTAPKKYGLALAEGDKIIEAGHITGRNYSDDGNQVSLTAVGLWTYLDWVKVFSSNFNRDTGDPTKDTVKIAGMTLAGIARTLIRNAADNPSVADHFPPIITSSATATGTDTRTYNGGDFTNLSKALADIIDGGGPDQAFYPEFTDSTHQAVRWVHVAGSAGNSLNMQAGDPHLFDTTVPRSIVTALTVDEDGTGIATRIWTKSSQSGGGTATGSNTVLVDGGYPLLEAENTFDTLDANVLTARTDQALLDSSTTTSTWTMTARIAATEIKPGDFANVYTRGHKAIADGVHLVRVVGLDGDHTGTVKISILPMLTDWANFDPNRIQRHYLEPDPNRAAAEAAAAAATPFNAGSFGGMGSGGAGKRATIATPWGDDGAARVIFEGQTDVDGTRYRYLDSYQPVAADPVLLSPFGDDGELIIMGRVRGLYIPSGGLYPGVLLHRALDPRGDVPQLDLSWLTSFTTILADDKGIPGSGLSITGNSPTEFTTTEGGTWDIEVQVTLDSYTPGSLNDNWGRPWVALFLASHNPADNASYWTEYYNGPTSGNNVQTMTFNDSNVSGAVLHMKDRRTFASGFRFSPLISSNHALPGANINQDASFLKITRAA